MKTFILKSIILLALQAFGFEALAGEIKMNLNVSMKLHGTGHYKEPRKNPFDDEDPRQTSYGPLYPSTQISQSWSTGDISLKKSISYNPMNVLTHGAFKHGEDVIVRNLEVSGKIETKDGVEAQTLTVKESRPLDAYGGLAKYPLRKGQATLVITNPKLSGEIWFKYRVPANTWLVKVSRSGAEGLLSSANSSYQELPGVYNALNRDTDEGVTQVVNYLWVRPGSEIAQVFKFENSQLDFKGTYQISFQPVAGQQLEMPSVELSQHLAPDISSLVNAVASGVKADSDEVSFIVEQMAKFLAVPENINQSVAVLSLIELKTILETLKKARDLIGPASLLDLKYAAVLLGHKLAVAYLSDLLPFCDSTTIDLIFQGEKIQTNWLSAANYLLNRAVVRLQNYSIGYAKSFVDEVSKFQKMGMTYSQLRKNTKQYEKLRKAFNLITENVDFRASPVNASMTDVLYLVDQVGSLGIEDRRQERVLSSLRTAAKAEEGLYHDMAYFRREFNLQNHQPIDISKINFRLNQMEELVGNSIAEINSNQQLFTLTGQGMDELSQMIIDLSVHQIGVYQRPMPIHFEYFRTHYFDSSALATMETQAMKCWKGQ